MKKLLLLLPILLTGCSGAGISESILSLGKGDAPPGYFNFRFAQQFADKKDFKSAAVYFCNAAELGYPQAKQRCVESAYVAAINNPKSICEAANYDKQANDLCRNLKNSSSKDNSENLVEQKIREVATAKEKAKEEVKKRKAIKKAVEEGKYKLKEEDF